MLIREIQEKKILLETRNGYKNKNNNTKFISRAQKKLYQSEFDYKKKVTMKL